MFRTKKPYRNRLKDENPLRPKNDEMGLIRAPPAGEEFPRAKSPTEDPPDLPLTPGEYLRIRNESVKNWIPKPDPHEERRSKKISPKPADDSSDDSDSMTSSYNKSRQIDTLMNMMKFEIQRRSQLWTEFPKDILKEGQVTVSFCYLRFQHCLQTKWLIGRLKRLERILKKEEVDTPFELVDMESEFEKIYGPVDRNSTDYKSMLETFKLGRIKMVVEMMEFESAVRQLVIQSMSKKDCEKGANILTEMRLELEAELAKTVEASMDMNPFISPLKMDFFFLPRPKISINSYDVHADEMSELVEFQKKPGRSFEGYNPAVLDVGLMYPNKIVNSFDWIEVLEDGHLWQNKLCSTRMALGLQFEPDYIIKLSDTLMNYPGGIEMKLFFKKFRNAEGLLHDTNLFEGYSDKEGVKMLGDVFHAQQLGKDFRTILFPGKFLGLILKPEEILKKTWKRLRFLMECERMQTLENLTELYSKAFGHPLNLVENWGFEHMADFIQYSFDIVPEEMEGIELVTVARAEQFTQKENQIREMKAKELLKEKEKLEKDQNKKFKETVMEACSKEWFPLEKPLPADFICKIVTEENDNWPSFFQE